MSENPNSHTMKHISWFSVFYYLCYEGAVDLDSIHDLNQRHALEVQIMEFGQIPKQIFTLPHPQRRTGIPPLMPTGDDDSAASSEMGMC
jgi:hypothetical protein